VKRGVWQPWKRQLSILVCVLGIGGLVLGVVSCDLFNRPPVATFRIGPGTAGTAPFPVLLTGTSTDPDEDELVYTWKFGDEIAGAVGEVVEHVFRKVGTWTIILIVTDSHGASDQTQMDVYVTAAAPAGPTAQFTVTPTSGPSPLSVTVDASGSTYSEATIVSYEWSFGDGTTLFGRTAGHTYVTPQTYTIALTVTGADGKTGRATSQVRATTSGGGTPVAGKPSARFVIQTDSLGVAPLQVAFDPSDSEAASGRTLILYAWSYDDGEAESEPGAYVKTHVFTTKTSSEVFSVALVVMDNASATNSITKPIKVYNHRPVAGFEIANPPWGWGVGTVEQYMDVGDVLEDMWVHDDVVYGNLEVLKELVATTFVRVWIRSKEIVDTGGAGTTNRWFDLDGTLDQHNLRTATTSAVSGGTPALPTGYLDHNFSYDPEGQTWDGSGPPSWFPSDITQPFGINQAWGIKYLYINWDNSSPLQRVAYDAAGNVAFYDYPIGNGPVYHITVTAEDYLGYQSAAFSRTVTLKYGPESGEEI